MQTISNQAITEQIQLIDSLLNDQDSVIEELDRLNDSIESLIDELAEERKAEGEQEEDSENVQVSKNVRIKDDEIVAASNLRAA